MPLYSIGELVYNPSIDMEGQIIRLVKEYKDLTFYEVKYSCYTTIEEEKELLPL